MKFLIPLGPAGDLEEGPAEEFGGNSQIDKFSDLIVDDIQLKDEELEENIDNVNMPQGPREDAIDEVGSLTDNMNAIFQNKLVMPNNNKSIIANQSNSLHNLSQCPFCEYRPVNTVKMYTKG